MERFKVVERETKTKAYSKEGMCTYLPPLCLISIFSLLSHTHSYYHYILSIYFLSISSPLPLFSSSHFHFTLILPSSSFLLYLSSPIHIPPPTPHSLSSTHTSYISTLYTSTSHFYTQMSFSMLIY